MIDKQYTFSSQQSDFLICEKIIKRQSKTFYFAFSQLPKEQAQSVFAIYAFCRKADDIVDLNKDVNELNVLKQKLSDFEKGNIPDEPIFRALSVVFSNYDMDINPFYDMLYGQEQDLSFSQPRTLDDLKTYAYYVAGSVGLMLIPILSNNPRKIKDPAKKLGEAMQLTNILRDIGEDYQMGRIYLPIEEMAHFNVKPLDFSRKLPTRNLIDLWEYMAQQAETAYSESLKMIPYLRQSTQQPIYVAATLYREILNEVRNNNYSMLTERQSVGAVKKRKIMQDSKKKLKEWGFSY